jgi:hypothetical protein
MEEFRETPFRRIDTAAPLDRGELLAVCGCGDFRGFSFGTVIAPQIIVIERLETFAYGNDGGAGGVESNGEDLIGGNSGFADDVASGSRQSAHVIFMRLRSVFGIFVFTVQGIFGDGGSEQTALAVHKRNANAQGSKVHSSNDRHVRSPLISFALACFATSDHKLHLLFRHEFTPRTKLRTGNKNPRQTHESRQPIHGYRGDHFFPLDCP